MIINKKRAIILLIAIGVILCLSGCCSHEWTDATCTAPKTCAKCGEIEGHALTHTAVEATCTTPKHCLICGKTTGDALGHSWVDGTCTEPKHCDVCGEEIGEAPGHNWIDGTCTSPKHCDVCGEEIGEAPGHAESEFVVTLEATLTNSGLKEKVCDVCGESYEKTDIPSKTPQVIGKTFNFADGELIEWANDWLNGVYFIYSYSGIDVGSDMICYDVETDDGEDGLLLLKHNGGEEVSAIMVYFDDVVDRAALALLLGYKISPDFNYDDAAMMVEKNAPYFCEQMVVDDLWLSDDMEVYLLSTEERWIEVISGTSLTPDDCYVYIENDNGELAEYANNMWYFMVGEDYSWYSWYTDTLGIKSSDGLGTVKTYRGIEVGLSTEEDVIAAYGRDMELAFNKNNDIFYKLAQKDNFSDIIEVLEGTKKVLVYDYNGQFQIAMYIDVTGYVDCITYFNGKKY